MQSAGRPASRKATAISTQVCFRYVLRADKTNLRKEWG